MSQRAFHTLEDEAETLSASLPPLMVEAERLAAAVSLGVHGRRKAGMGESFWQFRHYRAEDPSIAIDWRQSGKSQHLYVREREWEAAQSVWFWRDGSAGMRFKSVGPAKIDRATVLTLALASLLIRGGERIALVGEGHGPAASRVALRRIAHALLDRAPHDSALPPDAPVTKNAHFVWASDFLSPIEDIEGALRRLTKTTASGHLVHIIDPAEEDFPYMGRTRFESVEGKLNETLGRAESVAGAYRARFKAHSEAVAQMGRKLGWNYLAHRTDRPAQVALVALFADLSGAIRT